MVGGILRGLVEGVLRASKDLTQRTLRKAEVTETLTGLR